MNKFYLTLSDERPVIVTIEGECAGRWSVELRGPSISPTGFYHDFVGQAQRGAQPTEQELVGLKIWAEAKAQEQFKKYFPERLKNYKTWPIHYAANVELQIGELYYKAWPISWVEFNREWHFWVWDLEEVYVLNLNMQKPEQLGGRLLPAKALVGAWQEDGYILDYGKKTQRKVTRLGEDVVKVKARNSKVKPVQPAAQTTEVKAKLAGFDLSDVRLVNRLGDVTVYKGAQVLGHLSWLNGTNIYGDKHLVEVARLAHLHQHNSRKAFTLVYESHDFIMREP